MTLSRNEEPDLRQPYPLIDHTRGFFHIEPVAGQPGIRVDAKKSRDHLLWKAYRFPAGKRLGSNHARATPAFRGCAVIGIKQYVDIKDDHR